MSIDGAEQPTPEKEVLPTPEAERGEVTTEEIINVCADALGDEVREDFSGLDFDEALGYAFTLLSENDLDPDEIFESAGIILPE